MTEQEKKQQNIQWIVTGCLMALGLYNQLAISRGWAHFEVGDSQMTEWVTWAYELVVGLYTFWTNMNVTEDAKLSQQVLNGLKSGSITQQAVDALLDDTVQMVINSNVDSDIIETFLASKDLQEAVQAHLDGKNVNIDIEES